MVIAGMDETISPISRRADVTMPPAGRGGGT